MNNIYQKLYNQILRKVFKKQTKGKVFQDDDDIWHKTLDKWYLNKGDLTYKISYPLSKNSVVIDVGGYEGQWASDIYAKYQSKIYIVEPVSKYYNVLKARFKSNNRILPVKVGLGDKKSKMIINVYNENSSTFNKFSTIKHDKETIQITTFNNFLSKYGLSKVDLISINIEGGEYPLLLSILANNDIYKIQFLQIQFHRFVEGHVDLRKKIHFQLRKTHRLVYNYPYVWECWERLT